MMRTYPQNSLQKTLDEVQAEAYKRLTMPRLNQVLLAMLLVALILLAVGLLLFVNALRPAVNKLDSTLDKAGSALDSVDAAARTVNATAQENQQKVSRELTEFLKTTARLNDLVGHTDVQLNGTHNHPEWGLLPQLVAVAQRTDKSVNETLVPQFAAELNATALDIHETVTALRPSLDNLGRASGLAADRLADPAIAQAIENLGKVFASVEDTAVQVDATATDIRQVADKARATYLKPVNLWWGLVKEFLPLAGSAAQVVK